MTTQTVGNSRYQVGDWIIDPVARSFTSDETKVRVDPKAIDLLGYLSKFPGEVKTREEIMEHVWPGVFVGDDTLAKTISRLRKSLGDTAGSPQYIETVPKRGYRLIATIVWLEGAQAKTNVLPRKSWKLQLIFGVITIIVFATGLVLNSPTEDERIARADNLYMQFTQADNESAIGLYEQVLGEDPENALAQAGLANALVQRVVRWSDDSPRDNVSLRNALARGTTETPLAKQTLAQAEIMAERALRRSPNDPVALKAYGFVLAAQGRLEEAEDTYLATLENDPEAWAALVNLGELRLISEDLPGALIYLERAYAVMADLYLEKPEQIGGWQADLAITIGNIEASLRDLSAAEDWYRRSLEVAPYNDEATASLVTVLSATGRTAEAETLCARQKDRFGIDVACSEVAFE